MTNPEGSRDGVILTALAVIAYVALLGYSAYVAVDTSLDAIETDHASLPNVGWLQASVSSLETALPDRSVATRTGLGPTDVAAVSHSFSSSGSARPQEAAVWSWVRWAPRILRLAKKTITDVLARRAATKKAAEQAARAGAQTADDAARYSARQLQKFEQQLKQHGRTSVERSKRSIERRLEKHRTDLERYRREGGYTSKTLTEIDNFERELQAIEEVLRRSP